MSGLQLTTWRYVYIQSFRFEKALMKGAQYTIDHLTGYVREFIFNPETIDENVRKKFFTTMISKRFLSTKIRRAIGGTWKLR